MNLAPRSLRWRIQLWHGLLLLLVLAGFGVTAYRLNATNSFRQLDGELQMRLGALSAALDRSGRPPDDRPRGREDDRPRDERRREEEPPPERDGPPAGSFRLPPEQAALFEAAKADGFYFFLWRRDGAPLGRSANAPRQVPMPPRADDRIRTRNGFREAIHFTPPGECLLTGMSEEPLRAELRTSALKLTALGGIVLLVGLAGGAWLAARSIAPLQEISATARRIAGGALRERIPVPEETRELAEVAAVLNETFARLEDAFHEQARFTSDAAHELRTPVSIILAQAQLALARPRGVEELTETIATIRRSADRMKGLIESLLTLSLLDARGEAPPAEPCDLAALAHEQLEAMEPLAAERQITLESDCAPAPCTGDPGGLAQVFTNLIGNALKYCRPGDRVRVSTGLENGHALARVADTGPGIAAEHHAHLFRRFYRADASRNRQTGGAGLGLAICQTIVNAHGGSIGVEPGDAPGITFTFRVPRG